MDGKEEAAWLEGDSPSTLSSTCSSFLPPSPSFFNLSSSSSSSFVLVDTASLISAPFPASSMLLSRLERSCQTCYCCCYFYCKKHIIVIVIFILKHVICPSWKDHGKPNESKLCFFIKTADKQSHFSILASS